MIIVTVGFLKKSGLSAKRLSERGFEGLTMNVTDGTSTEFTHYVEFDIGVLGIWRRVEAFVISFIASNVDEVHLLLGMLWLHAVDAKIRIRESIIEIVNIRNGENVINAEGPQFIESESHKLVLSPKKETKSQPIEFEEVSSEYSEYTLYDSDDDSDESLSDAEIAKKQMNERGLIEQIKTKIAVKINSTKNVPKYPEKRKPFIRKISEAPQIEIDEWFSGTGAKIGELSNSERDKVTRL
ncbi:hypothetical protein OnM2_086045 [Erysiphe neolycopersici]|uniref:Uncharacterized protein n=1 Tax=Erysiphe neolycopersici TaxID=212602 RepID=A0A420HEH8_9PEZI|nr:hypothetical protein OnM2_086045 [Erysiphe neolycopersici]